MVEEMLNLIMMGISRVGAWIGVLGGLPLVHKKIIKFSIFSSLDQSTC